MHYVIQGRILCGATHVRGKWTDIESAISCEDCLQELESLDQDRVSLEDYTFGNARAEVNLARILNEINDPYLANKAGRLINRFNNLMVELEKMESNKTRRYVMGLTKNDFWDIIDKIDVSEKVRTHIKNVLTIRYRRLYNQEERRSDDGKKEKSVERPRYS